MVRPLALLKHILLMDGGIAYDLFIINVSPFLVYVPIKTDGRQIAARGHHASIPSLWRRVSSYGS